MTTTTQNSNENKFFDLTVRGVGYLNRFRIIQPKHKKSEPFCAVTIAALRGSADAAEYTYFDTIIRGKDACELLKAYEQQINDETSKVIASFVVSDIYPEVFEIKDSHKANIKGRLLAIKTLKIDGELVYSKAAEETDESEDAGSDETNEAKASNVETEQLPAFVELSKDDPDFEARKEALKSQGYRWDNDRKGWSLKAA